ncbi:MAG: hypothetical protein R2748_27445 [Bryobacterales bacterium]
MELAARELAAAGSVAGGLRRPAPAPQAQPAEAPPALTEKVPLPQTGVAPAAQRTQAPVQRGQARSPGFPSRRSFDQHFEKHGAEFGHISQEQYLALAQQLRDKPAGGPILELVREDGVVTRFDRQTGYFGAFNPDRTIRTFFIPNDGERYFERQARRPH